MQIRVVVGALSVGGLLAVFLSQHVDWSSMLGLPPPHISNFIINRSIRFILNDLFAIGLIFALFRERKYVLFAFAVQLFGLIFILVPYFILKTYHPTYNGPLINFIHRLVLNPLLMLLLIPAFYFQKSQTHRDHLTNN